MIFEISIIRWILILWSFYMIVTAFIRFFKREISFSFLKLLITVSIWSSILIISVFPDFAYFISKKLGMGKNLNTLIFFGFVVVFAIIFKILSLIEKLEKQLTEITRNLALKNWEKNYEKRSKMAKD